MGGRDYRQRETKKPKKEPKKAAAPAQVIVTPSPEPEVVGKRRPKREEESEP